MFDRLQKPFLTVETGEAYQPVRITYTLVNADQVVNTLDSLQCIQKNTATNSWTWYWTGECEDLHFESLDSFRRNPERPLRLGTITLRENTLYFNFPSFKRACLAVPFFHKILSQQMAEIHHADFINKVFALDERLPHGFTELFKDTELDTILNQRVDDYRKVKEQCEQANTAEEAFNILSLYTEKEGKKKLPYAERYSFEGAATVDPEVLFLAFYIFLRGRELVAIKRWFGQAGYSLNDAIDETIEKVFGDMGIDVLE
jgi:hypothetical protein